jgi:TPP-dependent pyruvate/acetoin dehydrogenase alpha subunit
LDPPKNMLVDMYRMMVRIRTFESAVRKRVAEGKIPVRVAPYSGQEAVAVGVCSNLRVDDYVTSTHRAIGHCIAKGISLKGLMAELSAKVTGCNRAKGGPYHVGDLTAGVIGANGIVGGGPPIAAGAALAAKLRGTDQVTVCFFGEGAANQGTLHETMNLAAVWELPLVFVCEFNVDDLFAHQPVGQPLSHPELSVKDIATRAAAYGIPGVTLDGDDVVAVYEAAQRAVLRARNGRGPSLVEYKTFKYPGPFTGPGAAKREDDWKKRDPILKFRTRLIKEKVLTEASAVQIEREEEAAVAEAVRFADESPEPDLGDALRDVFVSPEEVN